MPYKDSSKRREVNKRAQARRRGGDVEGVTQPGGDSQGVTRLNPANGLAYGPSMAAMPDRVLAEYERKWHQTEPAYGDGQPGENMACIACSEGFEAIYQSLATKHLEGEVRVGVYGPTVGELYRATHP